MALLCLLYFIAVGSCIGTAAHLTEQAMPRTAPRRWIWGVAIALSFVLPPVISARHSASAIELWGLQLFRLPTGSALGSATDPSPIRNWLQCNSPYGETFNLIWAGVTAVLLLWTVLSVVRVARLARRSGTTRVEEVDGVPAIVTDSIGPATFGVWRPRVLIPQWVLALPGLQRQYVLRHEDEHRRARDTMLLGIASVLVCLFPWNLALWWQLRRLRLAVEMDCDQRVVRALGDAPSYGELLLRVATAASRGPRLQPALVGQVGTLERRLTTLLDPTPRRLAERLVAPLLAVLVLWLVLSAPHPSVEVTAAPHANHATR